MVPRSWDAEALLRSIPWLRKQNRDGRNIFCRPKGEHELSLVDDLKEDAVKAMALGGFRPALVIETSPNNFQAWLNHGRVLSKALSTAVAKELAAKFGGDGGAADWRHFGRLAGFTNRKEKHRNPDTGLFPFVRLIEAHAGPYDAAAQFVGTVEQELARQSERRASFSGRVPFSTHDRRMKGIEEFRCDARYAGDGTRIDLAFAIYALAHGLATAEVEAAIRSRDLSHKGNEKRQDDYIDRTIRKALTTVEGMVREIGR